MYKLFLFILFFPAFSGMGQEKTRFLVTSDTHVSSPVNDLSETILYEIALAAIREEVDFIFFTGDLVIKPFSNDEEREEVLRDWKYILDTLFYHGITVYACRGNNESGPESWNTLFSGEFSFPDNGPEGEKNLTYSFKTGNIIFISLDQYVNENRVNQDWLNQELANNTQKHIFVAGHAPAFRINLSNTLEQYPEERNIFWNSLVNAGVKIYFCGHEHFYDFARIDNGDGIESNDVYQIITGTGSYSHSDGDYGGENGEWIPVKLYHEDNNGYVLVNIEGEDVQLSWKQRTDRNIFEIFGDSYSFVSDIMNIKPNFDNYSLYQNYPNPFNPETIISYQIPESIHVNLTVYDVLGNVINILIDEMQPRGAYDVPFNTGSLPSGVYFYRLQAGSFSDSRKMLLLR